MAARIPILAAIFLLAACNNTAGSPSSTPAAATTSGGSVGVILAGDAAGPRYVSFRTQLQAAFSSAGYEYRIDDGVDQMSQAQSDIAGGASVLVIDPRDDQTGAQVAAYARERSVKVITFERPIYAGAGNYHVQFDSVQAGKLIGQGFMKCVSDWNVKSPKVFVLNGGEDTDPEAVSLAKGYNQVLWGNSVTPQTPGKTNNFGYTLIGDQIAKGWDVSSGTTAFKEHYTAHKEINATLEANDDLGNAVIQVLKRAGVKPNTVPTTGQDATMQGMVNVVQGYQCGSVYRPLAAEARAIVAVATTLRAGGKVSNLVKGIINPPAGVVGTQQPAALVTPVWVTRANMDATVLKDGYIERAALCGLVGVAICQANNIPAS
jgi:D-xylose transport system substrate-binding protein